VYAYTCRYVNVDRDVDRQIVTYMLLSSGVNLQSPQEDVPDDDVAMLRQVLSNCVCIVYAYIVTGVTTASSGTPSSGTGARHSSDSRV